MNDTDRFNWLQEAAERLGIEVRHEEVQTEDAPSLGGLCRIAGHYILIINAKATMKEKVLIMGKALRQFDLDSIYIKPAIREELEGPIEENPRTPGRWKR